MRKPNRPTSGVLCLSKFCKSNDWKSFASQMALVECGSAPKSNQILKGTYKMNRDKDFRLYLIILSVVSLIFVQQAFAAPEITPSGVIYTFTEGGAGVAIDSGLTVIDGGANLNSASVIISGNFVSAEDSLSFTPAFGITGSYNATNGVLSLSGSATGLQYQQVLRSITYNNSNGTTINNAQRTFTYLLIDQDYYPVTTHFYEFIPAVGITWAAAKVDAESRDMFGIPGYLATVTSAGENQFMADRLAGVGWLGGSDAAVEGTWRWVVGPEGLMEGGLGLRFWQGNQSASPLPGIYENWNNGEPNNAGNEDYAHMIMNTGIGARGSWNDLPNAGSGGAYKPMGYVIEYGGQVGDPVLKIEAQMAMNINSLPDIITNASLTLNEGATGTVSSAVLSITDSEQSSLQLNLTLTAVPSNGSIVLLGNTLIVGSVILQSQVNANLLS